MPSVILPIDIKAARPPSATIVQELKLPAQTILITVAEVKIDPLTVVRVDADRDATAGRIARPKRGDPNTGQNLLSGIVVARPA